MSDKDPKRFLEAGIGKVDDVSDVDMSKLQYTSPVLESMIKDKVYDDLVKTVSAMAFADKSKSFMVKVIKNKYPTYCAGLTTATFNKWLEYYIDLSKAFNFNRTLCLGELVYMGMKKAEKSIDNPKDDFIVKLIDRIDDGTLSHKNKAEVIDKQASNNSGQTINTVNRIFAEASRFGGLNAIEIDDSDVEDSEEHED